MKYTQKSPQQQIVHRLKITQGHLKKVIEMVESDAYCIDVLHQSDAVQKSLRKIDGVILENHLKTCTAESIREGKADEAIQEIMQIFHKNQN